MKLVYICSPYAGDVESNVRFARAACCYAIKQGCAPIAVHLLYPQFLNDAVPAEREAGIRMGLRVLAACEELWVCSRRISEGMVMEIAEAKRLGIPIRYVSQSEIQEGIEMSQYGIWAKRSSASVFGAAEAWVKKDGQPLTFSSYGEAAAEADRLMERIVAANVSYFPREMEQSMKKTPIPGMATL